jgi:hypothetical protein
LIVKNTLLMSLWSFQGARAQQAPHEKSRLKTGLSKLSSEHVEVDVVSKVISLERR